MQLTKDEAAVCLMLSFLALIVGVIIMTVGDASSAAPHVVSSPNLGMALLARVGSALRYLSLTGMVAGLVGTLILPSRQP